MAVKKVRRHRYNLAFCRPSRRELRSGTSGRVASLPANPFRIEKRQRNSAVGAQNALPAMPWSQSCDRAPFFSLKGCPTGNASSTTEVELFAARPGHASHCPNSEIAAVPGC